MRHALVLLVVSVLATACGPSSSGSSSLGSSELSETECRQLLEQISELSYAGLSPTELAEVAEVETPEKFEEDVRQCVSEQNWTRSGYECAMKAASAADINDCIRGM